MKKQIVVVLAIIVILSLACNMSTNQPSSPTQDNQPAQGETNQVEPSQEAQQPGETSVPTLKPGSVKPTEIPSQPVSIKDGLASLNSYTMTISFTSAGPDPKDSIKITMVEQHSTDQDANLTHYTTNITKKDSSEPAVSENFIYSIGNDICSGSEEDWSWQTIPADQKEMLDIIKDMVNITPTIENPSFVAEETVNDIQSNHFSFKVSGLGAKSGVEVTANQGDYWLAVDGRYIVKYTLVLETRKSPDSEILHEEVSIDLTDINNPIDISFPQSCINAKNATPTPNE
jgi:hypothetical protein